MREIKFVENAIHEGANLHYRVESVEALDKSKIINIINDFVMFQLPRLELLDAYYSNMNFTIHQGQRRKNPDKSDHRASHGFAGAITSFQVNYLTGIPIRIESKDTPVTEFLNEFNTLNDIDAHHTDLATDLSKYGRAYELLHYSDDTRVFLSNPYWTIVIYDEGIEMKPIAALRFPKVKRGNSTLYAITLYTEDSIIEYEPASLSTEELFELSVTPHAFGGVPIVEYSHNRHRFGDFEPVLTQIDLYDAAQSDSANYMTDINDAVLVIAGDFEASSVEYNNDIDAILLPSGTDSQGRQTHVDAKYIYKQYDVAGTEAYKERIERDIYKFSKTPNLTAENFAGNQSGEAKRYMMIDAEQSRKSKERILVKGFNMRYKLLGMHTSTTREFVNEIDNLNYIFTPNMPESINEDLAAFISAGGQISNKTLLGQLSFVRDVEEELRELQAENFNWIPSDSDGA